MSRLQGEESDSCYCLRNYDKTNEKMKSLDKKMKQKEETNDADDKF